MTTKVKGHRIDVQGTPVEVVRKDIKNLHMGVSTRRAAGCGWLCRFALMTTPCGWPSFRA